MAALAGFLRNPRRTLAATRNRVPGLARALRFAKAQLPPVNYLTIHYAYFLVTCLLSSIIFWGASTPAYSVRYIDSLFLCVSAMTLAGLNTVNLSQLNTFQQFMMFLLIMLGSAIFVSAFTVEYRRRAFLSHFRSVLEESGSVKKNSISKERPSTSSARSEAPGESATAIASSAIQVDEIVSQQANGHSSAFAGEKLEVPNFNPNITTAPPDEKYLLAVNGDDNQPSTISFSPDTRFRNAPTSPLTPTTAVGAIESHDPTQRPPRRQHSIISMQGVGAAPHNSLHTALSQPSLRRRRDSSASKIMRGTDEYFASDAGYIARNSSFHNLTAKEREILGGVEYRALKWLSFIVPAYYILWQLLGALGLAAYVASQRPETAAVNALNPWWVGAFNAISAFNNSGMSLLDANMIPYQTAYYLIITMGLLILAGNTCYPIFLRLIIWAFHRYMPDTPRRRIHRTTLKFLLDHPRRCYTNLFPSRHTWWLLLAVVTLNGIDWVAFEVLNIGNANLTLTTGVRVIDGLFQAFAVRSGGFYIVPIPTLRIGLQVLYVLMMYISVYPVVITMRNSNVYEERSLGIYSDDTTDISNVSDDSASEVSAATTTNASGYIIAPAARNRLKAALSQARNHLASTGPRETKAYFVRTQIRAQLAHDLWLLFVAVFLIMIIESGSFEAQPAVFSVFNVIFEVVSAYGTVGISVGLPDQAYSFCGAWHTLSKLILCWVMIRGRHRGLPVAIDKAVILPGEHAHAAEEEDARIRAEMTGGLRVMRSSGELSKRSSTEKSEMGV